MPATVKSTVKGTRALSPEQLAQKAAMLGLGDTLVKPLPTTMWANLYYAPGEVRYEEIPIPQLGAGEILLKVGAALTCGTDLKCYRRGHPVLLKDLPSPFGHECAGTVAAVGEDVQGFQVGDRVVAANSAPCLDCFFCGKEQFNLCEKLDLLNGAYAEYLKVPARIVERNTHPLPETLPFEIAAFAEPLAIALRGVALMNLQPGEHVCVLGLGPIGQLLVKAAKLQGAHVTAMGRSELKRTLAASFGEADVVVDTREYENAAALKAKLSPEGRGFDAVLEVVGQTDTWEAAFELCRPGGRVNWFAGCPSGSKVSIDTRTIHYQEITVMSLFHHTPAFFKNSVELLSNGTVDPTPLITGSLSMNALTEAFTQMETGQAVKLSLKA